ncbi:hypothetical protein LTS18_014718, partial [Coniosporium uncinatum]
MVIALLTQRRRKQLADRAQHVVLASATFDPDGRLLVTPEGLLPAQKITRQYNQRSFNDEFDVAHPVYQWLFRMTHNWAGVVDIVPAMRGHLRAMGSLKDSPRPGSPGSKLAFESEAEEDYSVIFREHFCVAAAELADHLHTSLPELGVLHTEIMMTGSLAAEFQQTKNILSRVRRGKGDVETGIVNPTMFGK